MSDFALKHQIHFNRNYLLLSIFILVEIAAIVFLGLEHYNVVTVIVLTFFAIPIVLNPIIGIIGFIIITMGVEGRIIEEFILFRVVGGNWYVIDYILFFLLISLYLNFINGRLKLKWNMYFIWFFLLFLGLAFGIWTGLKNGNGFSNIFHDFRGFFYYLIFIPTYYILQEKGNLQKIFWSIIIIATIKSLIDSYFSIFVWPTTYDPSSRLVLNFSRLTGYSDVVYPILMVMCIVYFFLTEDIFKRIILLPPLLLSTLATFLGYTRGAWLGVVAAVAFFFLLMIIKFRDRFKIKYVVIFLFSTSFLLSILEITGLFSTSTLILRFSTLSVERIDTSNLGRLIEWGTALMSFEKNPLFGEGLGMFVKYYAPGMGHKNTIFIHNSYIFMLAKTGIVGITPFVIFYLSSLTPIRKLLKSNLESEEDKIIFTLLMVLIFVLVKGISTWHMMMWTFTPFLGIIFGIIYWYKVKK